MPKLRVHNFSMSLDGYAAGPAQSLDDPLGVGGERLHDWVFPTRRRRRMLGEDGGGGVATVQQYLRAGLVDDLHLAVVPVLLGSGERLLDRDYGLELVEFAPSATVAHIRLRPSSG